MIKINRYLAHKNKDITNIVFSVHFKGNRIKFTSKVSIPTDFWDSQKQKIKPDYRLHSSYNKRLQEIEDFTLDTYVELSNKNTTVDSNELKRIVKSYISGKHVKNIDIFQLFDMYIDNAKSESHLKETTEYLYRAVKKNLLKYSKETNQKLLVTDFDNTLINDYKSFCYEVQGNTDNTVNSKLNILGICLNYAFKNKYIDNQDYKDSLKVKKHKTESVALTDNEVELIENYSGDQFENTRFWFLVQIYTGVRYSDLSNIHNSIDMENEIIKLHTQKTNKEIIIPISNKLKELLTSNNIENYELLTNQGFKLSIKNLCKAVGITDTIKKTTFVKNRQIVDKIPKYKLIGSHTARRTFITRLIKNGVAPSEIMKITGHTTREAFDKYIRISEIEAVSKVKSALNGM